MKAFRFDAEVPLLGSGMKRAFGKKQDTGFARLREVRQPNPVDKISDRAQPSDRAQTVAA
jgi:hypothetical protein